MKTLLFSVIVLSSSALLSSCTVDSASDGTTYVEAQPGYTGYTLGVGSYNISNGYGPEFWDPGYDSFVGYNRAYYGPTYFGNYRGGRVSH